MKTTKLAVRSYRRDCNALKIVEREYDNLLHKLCSIKKPKRRIKKEIPELSEIMHEVKQEDQENQSIMEKDLEGFTILEDLPICIKDEPGLVAKNQEAFLRYKRRKKLGYKNYLARHFFKNGKLTLRKSFLNL